MVGIWHGPAWHFIAYGLYNGLIIGVSGLLAVPFRNWRKKAGVRDGEGWFGIFQILRTFLIVNISWFLDRSVSLGQAFLMFKESFRGPFFSVNIIDPGDPLQNALRLAMICLGSLVIFGVSVLRERGKDVRGMIAAAPAALRIVLFTVLLLICAFTTTGTQGGFIYANF